MSAYGVYEPIEQQGISECSDCPYHAYGDRDPGSYCSDLGEMLEGSDKPPAKCRLREKPRLLFIEPDD